MRFLYGRLRYLWEIFGPLYSVISGLYAFVGVAVLARDELLPDKYHDYTIIHLLPEWHWQTWVIIGLLILILGTVEGGFRKHYRAGQDPRFGPLSEEQRRRLDGSVPPLFRAISALIFVVLVFALGMSAYRSVMKVRVPYPAIISAIPSPPSFAYNKVRPITKRKITPCTMKGGTYYAEPRLLPGGAKLDRPMLELSGGPATAWNWNTPSTYLFLLELGLTNRGEASIIKGWELCLLDHGKPSYFGVGRIPDSGITLPNGENIQRSAALPEVAARTPVEHAHYLAGWVPFLIPNEIAQHFIGTKQTIEGSIRYEDYLAHKYSWDFTIAPGAPPTGSSMYMPGKN